MRPFGPAANLAIKLAVVAAVVLAAILVGFIYGVPWMDYNTQVRFAQHQPVPFSHKHHVSGLGLDCRYCHTAVEVSANAGIPPIETCMTCHSEIWTNAPVLSPIRVAFATGQPLHWHRINTLPDYVYFNHSIHIAKGIGCVTCHGPIGQMPLVWKAQSLYMSWCISCHVNPAPNLRPHEAVFDPDWRRGPNTPSPAALMKQYHIKTRGLTDCSVCHR